MAIGLPSLPLTQAGWVFGILIAIILLVPPLTERARVPSIVGLILAGMVVGPHVAGLLERHGAIELLGTVGLLYLVFVAGLELDLEDFAQRRRASVTLGVLSFAIPMAIGAPIFLLMGFEPVAGVLLASCWASHTLLTYPVFRRFGTFANRAVATTVGATIITDTAALLVLAIAVSAHRGSLGPAFWLTLIPAMGVFLAATLWGLPRLARYFFSGPGQPLHLRFLFALLALFASAAAAEVAGIEGIVGAFLAGLALNRLIPNGGELMERIEFLGSTLLIPLFLVSVGMLVDPRGVARVETLVTAGAFTAVALFGKFAAAFVAGKLFRFGRSEIGAAFALSGAQAAATLAAVIVGFQAEILDQDVVNAVVIVILATCLVSSGAANRYAPRLPRPGVRWSLGRTVVTLVDPRGPSEGVLRLAATLARSDAGIVMPVSIVPPEAGDDEVAQARERNTSAVQTGMSHGAESRGLVRIDLSQASGVRHTILEYDGTLVVLGWRGHGGRRESLLGGVLLFGAVIDAVLAEAEVPVVVARTTESDWDRILLVVGESDVVPAARPTLGVAVDLAKRLAGETGSPIVVAGQSADDPEVGGMLGDQSRETIVDRRKTSLMLHEHARPTDVVVVPVAPARARVRGATTRIARAAERSHILFVFDTAATAQVTDARMSHTELLGEPAIGSFDEPDLPTAVERAAPDREGGP
ncbi:MAG TPA: cation:proton antiporter [Actinomycetota bacterium]|nr:cation:proton antiporter [Actinomycetota bacterium]